MGFWDQLSDATVTTPKFLFEKDCETYTCYSLENLALRETIKAKIIDRENGLIQFSGNVIAETKAITGRKFFADECNRVLDVDFDTVEVRTEEIRQKSKTGEYETTVAKFAYKKLTLE